jgi:hypothetical protein
MTPVSYAPDTPAPEAMAPRWFTAGLAAIVVAVLIPCAYAHPMADDLDFALARRADGLWHAAYLQYVTWNGRYASNLLALLTPLAWGSMAGYRLTLAVLAAAAVPAMWFLLRGFESERRVDRLTPALLLAALYFAGMPSIGEGIYWHAGNVVYHAGAVVALVGLGCLARYATGRGVRWLAAGTVVMFVAVGFDEVLMLMLGLFAAAVLGIAMKRREKRIPAFAIAAGVLVGTALLVLSPGNAARNAVYPAHHRFGLAMAMSGLQTVRFLSDWAAGGAWILASVLAAPALATLVPERLRADAGLRRDLQMLLIGAMVAAVPAAAFPAYWATGILGQHRTVNLAFLACLLAWFAWLAVWSAAGGPAARALQRVMQGVRAPLAAFTLLALVGTGNLRLLALDVATGRLAAFDGEMRARAATLSACKVEGVPACAIEPIRVWPAVFFVLDVSSDPHDWVNEAYARFYGVRTVTLAPASRS